MRTPVQNTSTRTLIAMAAMAALGGGAAWAQSTDSNASRLSLSVGANRTTSSLFKGLLIQSRTDLLLDASYERGRWFASLQNGVGYKLLDSEAFTLGLSANYLPGRYAANDARYLGMGDVAGTVSGFGYFEWRPVKDAVTVYGNLAQSLKSANGRVGTLGGTLGFPVSGKLNGFFDVYLTWGNSGYNQTFYGVNAAQAVSSGYAVFNAPSGLVSTTPTLGLTYELNRNWSIIGYAGQTRLSSGIGASPMVKQRTQPLAAVLTSWTY